MRWLTALLLLHTIVSSAMAAPLSQAPPPENAVQATTVPAETITPRNPTALWKFSNNPSIHAFTIAPDGKTAFICMTYNAVNAWALLVNYWPEQAMVVVSLLLLWMIRRTWKHGQDVGEPYCRQCLYQLTNLQAKNCPECGGVLTRRNRIIGRKPPWRAVALIGVLGALVGAYVLFGNEVHRGWHLQRWLNWSSPGLYEWSVNNRWDWMKYEGGTQICRVLEVNMADGSIRRVVSEEMDRKAYSALLYSPQENSLIGLRSGEGRIDLIAVRSGAIRPLKDNRYVCSINKMVLDSAGRYVFAFGPESWRINVRSAESERMQFPIEQLSGGSPIVPVAGMPKVWIKRGSRDASANQWRWQTFEWNLEDNQFSRRSESDPVFGIFISKNELWIVADSNNGIEILSIPGGESRVIPGTNSAWWGATRWNSAGSRFLRVETQSNRIGVFDVARASHVATLQTSARGDSNFALTSDGRTALAVLYDSIDGLQKIAQFDLSDLPLDEGAASN